MSVPSSTGGPGSVTSGVEEAREGTSYDQNAMNAESTRSQKSSKNLRSHDLCITVT